MSFTLSGLDGGSGLIRILFGDAGAICTSGPCVFHLDAGTAVTALVESSDLGFERWSSNGGCGTEPWCPFFVTGPMQHTAHFAPLNLVFVTSGRRAPGSFGGRGGADGWCQAHAQDAGLVGTFKAYLRTDAEDAYVRFENASGWVRPDGKPVFRDALAAANGAVLYPPNLDERGRRVTDGGEPFEQDVVVTGGYLPGGNCAAWTDVDAGLAEAGRSSVSNWFGDFASVPCNEPARLYCLGVDRKLLIVASPAVGRFAFRSSGAFVPVTGGTRDNADDLCRNEAVDAGLPGSYLALLAGPNAPAVQRFLAGPPWVRRDGIVWAPDAGAFIAGRADALVSSLNVDAWGVAGFSQGVWTGGSTPTLATTCDGWSTSSSSSFGASGRAEWSYLPYLLGGSGSACNSTNLGVICMQE